MPFPSDGCSPTELPVDCCDKLYRQGLAILTAILDELEPCLVPNACCDGSLSAFVSLGPPEVLESDILAVSLDGAGMEFSPGDTRQTGLAMMPPSTRSVWRAFLLESNYPGMGDDDVMPGPDELAVANHYGYSHAEAMYRGVLRGVASRAIGGCDGFVITDLTPVPRSIGISGWTAGWTLGLKLGFDF